MSRDVDLRYFDKSEFGDWWGRMSVRLLVLLDVLRHQWGEAIEISPHPRALGREDGDDNDSQHNVDRWGEVRAADLLPRGMDGAEAAESMMRLARRVGFTGVGLYPDWSPRPGIHVDVRVNADPGDPALWGMVDDGDGQRSVALEKAVERMA